MPDYRCKVTLPYEMTLATNVSLNDFAIQADDDTALDDVLDNIVALYNNTPVAGPNSISDWISPVVTRDANACSVKAYDRTAAPLAPPHMTREFTLGAALGGNTMPSEVALVVSLLAGTSPGENNRRRRGRLYIGPFVRDASALVGDVARPDDAVIATLVNNFQEWYDVMDGLSDRSWQVWSQADGAGHDVTSGYVDDAWDTMRSRGMAPSARTFFG